MFIQDGDPRQNSAKAWKAIASIGAKLLVIPPRSPDLNPIENVFHLVRKRLDIEAFEQKITHETFNQYTARVKNTLYSMDKAVIDNIIVSMSRRIDLSASKIINLLQHYIVISEVYQLILTTC